MGIIERNIGNLHDQDTGALVGYRNPVTGKQEDLNAPALQALVSGAGKRGRAARQILWDYAVDGSAAVSVVSASCTISAAMIDGEPALKITGTSAAQAQVDIDLSAVAPSFLGPLGLELAADRANTGSISMLASADAGFAAYAHIGYNPSAASNTSSWTYRSVQPYTLIAHPNGSPADTSWSPGYQGTWVGTPPTYPTELNRLRIRILNTNGLPPVAYIKRVFSLGARKSRIAITLDDGYSSAYRLLLPVLNAYDLPATWSIIADQVGKTAQYMRQSDLRRLYDMGHALVAHGPIGGTGNIVTKYPTVAEAVADVQYHRDTLASWGLLRPGDEQVYVWPQGNHQGATDDLSYRSALRQAGFTVGRSASNVTCGWIADLWPESLVLPIVGHTQAASSGAEATNITNIVAAINNAAARGTDLVLMSHQGVPSTDTAWGSNGGLNIRTTDYATICAAIKANVTAGTQEAVLLRQFVPA